MMQAIQSVVCYGYGYSVQHASLLKIDLQREEGHDNFWRRNRNDTLCNHKKSNFELAWYVALAYEILCWSLNGSLAIYMQQCRRNNEHKLMILWEFVSFLLFAISWSRQTLKSHRIGSIDIVVLTVCVSDLDCVDSFLNFVNVWITVHLKEYNPMSRLIKEDR